MAETWSSFMFAVMVDPDTETVGMEIYPEPFESREIWSIPYLITASAVAFEPSPEISTEVTFVQL